MSYFRNVQSFGLAQAVAAILAFFYSMIAARLLGVAEFGLFQGLMGIYAIAASFVIPLNLVALHYAAENSTVGKSRLYREILALALLTSCLSGLGVFVAGYWIVPGYGLQSFRPLFAVGGLVVTTGVLTVLYGFLQGENHYAQFSLNKMAQAAACLLFGIPLMMSGHGVLGALEGYILGMAAVIGFLLFRFRLLVPDFHFSYLRREIKSVSSILIVLSVILLIDNGPMILARLRFSETSSGIYGAVYNLRNAMWPFAFAIILPLYSHMKSKTPEKNIFRKGFLLTALFSAIFMAVGFLFPEYLLKLLYGKDYLPAAPYLGWYGMALFAEMVCMLMMFRCLAEGHFPLAGLAGGLLVFAVGILLSGNSLAGLIGVQALSALVCTLFSVKKPKGERAPAKN